MEPLMSSPTHSCPASSSTSPLSPLPHPMSSSSADADGGRARSSKQREAISDWIDWILDDEVYFCASASL